MPSSAASQTSIRPRDLELCMVCPGFCKQLGASLQRMPALERLIAYSSGLRQAVVHPEWHDWQCGLLSALALPCSSQHASAPLTVLGADGHLARTGVWMHAAPIELAVAAHGLVLTSHDSWPEAVAQRVDAEMKRYCAIDQGDWIRIGCDTFVRLGTHLQVTTTTPRAATSMDLQQAFPSGPDAAQLRRIMTEMQMVLHDLVSKFPAPQTMANPMPNAIWLWGAGRVTAQPPRVLPQLWADDPYARGLYDLYGAAARVAELPHHLDQVLDADAASRVVVVRNDALLLEQNWFAPAVRALDTGRVHAVNLYLDGYHARARRSHRLRLRHWFVRPRPLELPV